MDVFHDAHCTLFEALRKHDLRKCPFHHDVEASGDELDARWVLGTEVVDPILRRGRCMVPTHVDKVLPVYFIEGVFFDDCELFCEDVGLEGEDKGICRFVRKFCVMVGSG